MNNIQLMIGAVAFIVCVIAVTMLNIFGKDATDLMSLIQLIATVASGWFSMVAAGKAQQAHDGTVEINEKVNGRMTELIAKVRPAQDEKETEDAPQD